MEAFFWCLLGFLGIAAAAVACLVVASFLGLSVGLTACLTRKWTPIKDRPILTWLLAGLVVICGLILAAVSYGVWRVDQSLKEFATQIAIADTAYAPQYFNPENEEMRPFIAALNAVDRASLGFTPIPSYARVEIEKNIPPATYDVMLHIYGDTSRTIAFKRDGNGYIWLGEQEIHTGPKKYMTADGLFNEEIVVNYDTVNISGAPLNMLDIMYFGEDPRLEGKLNLTLQDIQPILEEWRRVRPTPTSP